MTATQVTSREFNQDTGGAKRAALAGPVYITDRGRPSHVLLSFDAYARLAGDGAGITDLLAEPAGVEDVEFDITPSRAQAKPAIFD